MSISLAPFHGPRLRALAALLVIAALLIPVRSVQADHDTRDGLYTDTHYISVQFSYQFTWQAPWEVDEESVESVEGEYDRIVVGGPDGTVESHLTFGDDLDAGLEAVIEERTEVDDGLEVLGTDEGETQGTFGGDRWVAATLAYTGPGPGGEDASLIEFVEIGAVGAVGSDEPGMVAISLVAPEDAFGDVFAEVAETFVRDQGWALFFAGEPATAGGQDGGDTGGDDGADTETDGSSGGETDGAGGDEAETDGDEAETDDDDREAAVALPRGDAGRSGAMPDAGPTEEPTELWRFDAQASVVRSPAIVGDTAYVTTKNGGLFAVDTASGEERWAQDLGEEATVFPPAVADGLLVVTIWGTDDPVLAGFDRETGEETWRRELSGTPTEPVAVDGVLYVAAGGWDGDPSALYALEPDTGEEVWRTELPDAILLNDAVAVADGLVFATATAADGTDGVGLYAVDAATGEIRWTFAGSDQIISNAAVSGGVVVVVDLPTVWGLDAESGEELWQVRGAGVGGGKAVVDGTVYLSFEEEVRAVDAETGEELWTAEVAGIPGAAAVADGVVYVGAWRGSDEQQENHWFYALDAVSGDEVWAIETDLTLSGVQPVVLGGVLYADASGYLVAIGSPDGADTDGDSTDGDGTDGDRDGEDLGRYESPQYGYALEYDPEEWEVDAEDEDLDDPYDTIQVFNGTSLVMLVGDPDYDADEMNRCVREYAAALAGAEEVEDLEAREGGEVADAVEEEDGTASVEVAFTFDGQDLIRHIACTDLGEGVTLVVLHTVRAADYDDEVAAREDLLEGLEPAGGR